MLKLYASVQLVLSEASVADYQRQSSAVNLESLCDYIQPNKTFSGLC
jgi:hypothetical protein